MMNLFLGLLQLIIALILLHRVMPAAQARSNTCSIRVWCFAFAIACYGGESVILGLGYPPSDLLPILAHLAIIVTGALWIKRAHDTTIRGWFDLKG